VGRTPKNQLKIYHRATSNQDVFSDAVATKNTKEVKRFAGKDIIAAVKVVLLERLILSEVRTPLSHQSYSGNKR